MMFIYGSVNCNLRALDTIWSRIVKVLNGYVGIC